MSEDDSSIRSWSELPVSVLAYAFEKLDLRDRAGTSNCIALFCTSWAAAAAAATRSIELSRCTNTDSLQQWLRSRGSHVIKAKLRSERGIITSLPCPRLKRLVLEDISVDLRPGSQLLIDLSAAAALEHLQLDDVVFQDEGMQFVCKLTQLHSLELHNMEYVTAAGLAGLHNLPALKRLVLKGLHCEISASAVPAFTQLTALTCLKLRWAINRPRGDFYPSVLAHMTRLEELHLHRPKPAGYVSGAAELLARLAQLPKLQVLHLAGVDCLLQCPPAAFSSLTASSAFRSLTWVYDGVRPGPWQHIFPDSLQLSALTELETAYGPSWEAPDLDRLVSSCSNLQKLSLCCTPGLQLTALLQLSNLRQLWLEDKPDSSTMAILAQLTGLPGLQRLAVTGPWFGSSLFIPLTALTQLTYLALPYFSKSGSSMEQILLELHGTPSPYVGRWPSALSSVITSTAPAGAPPDVWSQLLSCCESCAAQATQQHMGALAEELHYLQVELEAAILQQLEDGDEAQQHEEEEEEPLAGPG